MSGLAPCHCPRWSGKPCKNEADAEDLLCEICRRGGCTLLEFEFSDRLVTWHAQHRDARIVAARVIAGDHEIAGLTVTGVRSEAGSEADVRDLRLRRARPG